MKYLQNIDSGIKDIIEKTAIRAEEGMIAGYKRPITRDIV